MDRCAVFVDAGYLHESAKTLLLTGHPGATVRANAKELVREITALAVEQTQLPLLRIYWYAAAPNRNPYPDQRELASHGDIKLRLGNLRERSGGRMVQKGVDAELHADMTGLARNHGAVDFVLLSGDEDLLRAVDEVQSYGVRVHLWGVEAGPDGGNQSLELIAASDRRHVLQESWISRVFTILEPPKPHSPMATAPSPVDSAPSAPSAPTSAPTAPTSAPAVPTPPLAPAQSVAAADPEPAAPAHAAPAPAVVAKPTDIRPRPIPVVRPPTSTLTYSSDGGTVGYSATPDAEFFRLSDLTTQAEQFADSAEDSETQYDAISAGRAYARRWLDRATAEAADQLVTRYPNIPSTIDAELLRFAVGQGIDTWASETDKFAVRQGFWSTVRAGRRAANPTP